MCRKNLFSLVFWVVSVSLIVVVSAQLCSEKFGTFTPGGTFDRNRRLILSSLPSEVTAQDGFYNASIGTDPDQLYAMGMCIPGAKQKLCRDCMKDVTRMLIQTCPNQIAAIHWSGGGKTVFMARYYNRPSSRPLDLDSVAIGYNDGNLRTNLTDFDRLWERLVVHMVTKASSSSIKYLSFDNSRFYAADEANLTSFQMIYALMQCTPDVSPSNCNTCLKRSVGDYVGCCHGKQGGYVYRPNCIFRWDLYPFNGAFDLLTLAPPPSSQLESPPPQTKKDEETIHPGITIGIVVATVIIMALLALGVAVCRSRKKYQAFASETADDITTVGYLQFDIKDIEAATSNFLASNKIGQGGFGEGTFSNGTEVAVKRLSRTSDQGELEFKNEVLLVAKLQHRNLVRLLGFALQGEEKILVFEFVPNKSLDYFLFGSTNPTKKGQLDWTRRYNIIGGITRGILYLHQDSRLTIIHRDIKASNILLDANMNPKIADFGMARNFRDHQTEDSTGRVVGTFGYMPPEYVTHGQFSTKFDVYSFGVLILEIVSGRKNSSFYQMDGSVCNLVTYVWRLWNTDTSLELIDPAIRESYEKDEVTRCIHIGLLCVQENPANRPAMSTVFQMLTNSSITLNVPQPPGFFFRNRPESDTLSLRVEQDQYNTKSVTCSIDDATITTLTPR
ncbi:kinase family protein [Arabidopsis lyrata subsp. lyrata]|uniref:Kinase family protein n=1 Tax=Arabidopsis lyrata subsp. lyrata TaxID=81972 RepID=D7LZK6_ARALL|nr:kinase family protein [Arabidopsis lyrata subsp. lyrata]